MTCVLERQCRSRTIIANVTKAVFINTLVIDMECLRQRCHYITIYSDFQNNSKDVTLKKNFNWHLKIPIHL